MTLHQELEDLVTQSKASPRIESEIKTLHPDRTTKIKLSFSPNQDKLSSEVKVGRP
jgi:hypothetical protein